MEWVLRACCVLMWSLCLPGWVLRWPHLTRNTLHTCALVAQSCPTFCDPIDCSPPGSSIHGILQARMQEWVATPFSRRSSWPRDWTQVSHTASGFFNDWATGEAPAHLASPYRPPLCDAQPAALCPPRVWAGYGVSGLGAHTLQGLRGAWQWLMGEWEGETSPVPCLGTKCIPTLEDANI